jgi:uncharacterized protein YfeS
MTNEDGYTLATPHPAFARHFGDPLYDSSGDEFAPFGSDEGSDLLATWAQRRAELDETSTLGTVLGCEPDSVSTYAGPMDGINGLETAMFITSAAFVLLRLTGHINEADRQQALDALDFQINTPPLPDTPASLVTQRRDLGTWRNPD